MSIIYNGTTIDTVKYNGTTLDTVNYNNTEVFSGTKLISVTNNTRYNISGIGRYKPGTSVTLSLTDYNSSTYYYSGNSSSPSSGDTRWKERVSWSGDYSGSTYTLTFTMPNNNVTLTLNSSKYGTQTYSYITTWDTDLLVKWNDYTFNISDNYPYISYNRGSDTVSGNYTSVSRDLKSYYIYPQNNYKLIITGPSNIYSNTNGCKPISTLHFWGHEKHGNYYRYILMTNSNGTKQINESNITDTLAYESYTSNSCTTLEFSKLKYYWNNNGISSTIKWGEYNTTFRHGDLTLNSCPNSPTYYTGFSGNYTAKILIQNSGYRWA